MADRSSDLYEDIESKRKHVQSEEDTDRRTAGGHAGSTEGPTPVPANADSLLGTQKMSGRGNRPVQTALMQQMQETYGNRATRNMIQRQVEQAEQTGPANLSEQTGPDLVGGQAEQTDQADKKRPLPFKVTNPGKSSWTVMKDSVAVTDGRPASALRAGTTRADYGSWQSETTHLFDIEREDATVMVQAKWEHHGQGFEEGLFVGNSGLDAGASQIDEGTKVNITVENASASFSDGVAVLSFDVVVNIKGPGGNESFRRRVELQGDGGNMVGQKRR